MRQRVLIFYPDRESYLGLWQPGGHTSWIVREVPRGSGEGNPLFQSLDNLLAEAGLTVQQLTHVGVMHGPASYTQLRSFVAVANALAWSLRLPLFSFDPTVTLPDQIPELLTTARVNTPVEPVYPGPIG